MQDSKRCSRCREMRPLTDYYKSKAAKDGLQHRCKTCQRYSVAEDYRTKGLSPHTVNRRLVRKYGITLAHYEELLRLQGGVCAICSTRRDIALGVDHDHSCCPGDTSCGKCVRGLLCDPCNRGLGFFRDNPDRLRTAISYLEKE